MLWAMDLPLLNDMIELSTLVLDTVALHERSSFLADRDAHDLVAFPIALIGDTANALSAARRNRYPEIPWRPIIALRHRLIHAYSGTNWLTVWFVATGAIPKLLAQLVLIRDELAVESVSIDCSQS